MVRDGPCIIHVSEISYMPVHVGFVKQGKAEEGKEFLKEIKAKGLWGAQEKALREALKSQEESEVQSVLDTVLDDSDDENEDNTIPEHFEGMETFFYKNIKTLFPFRHHCAAMNMFNGLVEDYQNLCQVEVYQNLCK
ncbi:hypothetical protein RchiOBHm_Chr3g0459091 [Rosa chinensis]|uniref:Uncharacterized protein n=1 Tax=Rosa chinensis TaxID=74649 RepID=A0A2P6R803_ROSCH|nr:uncharacterized protein LOC112192595 [Rosa chinensis]PRQ42570.1 hypothetical protein RchiOBHm_Chr3g0459091 [Rosa chinensis]